MQNGISSDGGSMFTRGNVQRDHDMGRKIGPWQATLQEQMLLSYGRETRLGYQCVTDGHTA
jgi:hypothetical protein